jgi:outer membrane beta-barrel protein
MKKIKTQTLSLLIAASLGQGLVVTQAQAIERDWKPTADNSSSSDSSAASQDSNGAERVNVENIKEKYWARGDETEMGVVQNRTYSKERKIELGVFGGVDLTDPFLNVNNLGFSLGYHFSEYIEARALYWKYFSSYSSALNTFNSTKGGVVNYNEPQSYYGGEAVGSLLYGKLSVIGKSIIYFDLHVLGGMGLTSTENGTYITPHLGLGQQVYVAKNVSLSLDYRLMFYHEEIKERTVTNHIGEVVGTRNNFSNVITFGANFMFGGPKEKDKSGASKQ